MSNELSQGDLLWQPTAVDIENANLTQYRRWLADTRNIQLDNYDELWQWSVDHLEQFWQTLWSYFALTYEGDLEPALVERTMPGAQWFPQVRVNYAENIFAQMSDAKPMMLYKAENASLVEISWADVYDQVNRLAQVLRDLGVEAGDRVVAYLPHIPETIIAMLATAAIGAIWSSCSPDFGQRSVLDRYTQIEPKVLIAVDGYQYHGRVHDRTAVLANLQTALPTLEKTILIPFGDSAINQLTNTILWDEALANATPPTTLTFARLPFDHPLWVLYSSGTTGLPKPIVQGHGGILLEHAKNTIFHNDLKPHDRFFWYTSTGWMMWNYVVGSLLSGATIIVYNGSPAYPDMNALFALAEESKMTYFGTSAAFVSACIKAGINPNQEHDLSRIRGVGSTGSPLTMDGFAWVYENINQQLALESLSGGTDLCTAFVGGARVKPIYAGEIQGAALGAKVQAYDENGQPIIDEVGELVITEPMPSMPLYFWGDEEMARYKASYFEMFPNVWRHGDWISFNERGGCVIYGRSDSTINRQGIRMGTAEIYRVVASFDEIQDSLIVDLELLGRDSYMPLFVVLRDGAELTEALQQAINQKLRAEVSPRHVPNEMIAIEQVPYTLSGKKMEVPVRKILLGIDVAKAANRGAMRNPEAIDFFVAFGQNLST